MNDSFSKTSIVILVILCILSRLPQLLSGNLILDGDECIVGLMAKHFIEGKEIPYFFYGQSYGFSFIEVLFIGGFYTLFGINDISIKLAMLLMWTLSIILFHLTLIKIEKPYNKWLPLLIVLVFIFSPSWAIWSMKARGGYLTAFLISNLFIYLVFKYKEKCPDFICFIMGFLLVIIYQSQPLWLLGVFPIAIFYRYKLNNISSISFKLLGVIVCALLFYILKLHLSDFWEPKVISLSYFSFDSLMLMPLDLWRSLTGSYFYSDFINPILSSKIFASIILFAIFLSFIFGIFVIIKKKKICNWFYIFCFSVLIYFIVFLFVQAHNYRYFLPFLGFALLMFYLLLNKVSQNRHMIINYGLLFIILMGSISLINFKNFKPENKLELIDLVNEIEHNKIKYVFCEGGLLQWQIMFYSNERVIARYRSGTDRYPNYISIVDNAFKENNNQTALVGFNNDVHLDDNIIVNNTYFIYKKPSALQLISRNFEIINLNELEIGMNDAIPLLEVDFNYESHANFQNVESISDLFLPDRKCLHIKPENEFGITYVSNEIKELSKLKSILFFSSDFYVTKPLDDFLFVVSISENDNHYFYKTINLKDYISDIAEWERINLHIAIPKILHEKYTMSVYLWNQKSVNIFVDNFSFKLYAY